MPATCGAKGGLAAGAQPTEPVGEDDRHGATTDTTEYRRSCYGAPPAVRSGEGEQVTAGEDLTDDQLWRLVLTLEDEMCAEGVEPKKRHFDLPTKAMERLGFRNFPVVGTGAPPLLSRIGALQGRLYRRKDVAAGGVHGGAFMFRGIATNVHVPIIYGQVALDPYDCCDLSAAQIDWLRSTPGQDRAYLENFCNLFDFAGCLRPMSGYSTVPKGALPMLRLSALQTQGAGATLCAAFDERGAVQSALIAAELSMKGALAAAGVGDSDLRRLGHDFAELARKVGEAYAEFDLEGAMVELGNLPELVPNRYSAEQPGRNETGLIVMSSQAIGGAVARALTGGGLLAQLQEAP